MVPPAPPSPNFQNNFPAGQFQAYSNPGWANFDSIHLCSAGGVAIFHLASSRVVVCRHSLRGEWFLPKGRRDAGEDSVRGAEREGYEESGYRNRLLPLPVPHIQPAAHNVSATPSPFLKEPLLTQLMPIRRGQYICSWYIAETVTPDLEVALNEAMVAKATPTNPTPYEQPPPFPEDMTLQQRIALELRDGQPPYKPVRHPNTGVNSEEALYESYLLSVEDAERTLRGTAEDWVVRRGWELICQRDAMERATAAQGS